MHHWLPFTCNIRASERKQHKPPGRILCNVRLKHQLLSFFFSKSNVINSRRSGEKCSERNGSRSFADVTHAHVSVSLSRTVSSWFTMGDADCFAWIVTRERGEERSPCCAFNERPLRPHDASHDSEWILLPGKEATELAARRRSVCVSSVQSV
jgi:hypothetical protein